MLHFCFCSLHSRKKFFRVFNEAEDVSLPNPLGNKVKKLHHFCIFSFMSWERLTSLSSKKTFHQWKVSLCKDKQWTKKKGSFFLVPFRNCMTQCYRMGWHQKKRGENVLFFISSGQNCSLLSDSWGYTHFHISLYPNLTQYLQFLCETHVCLDSILRN